MAIRRVSRRPAKKQGPEHIIQNNIIAALKMHGHLIYRANVGLLFTKDGRRMRTGLPVGFPDLFGCRKQDHQMFLIEVKAPKGRLSESQKMRHYEYMHQHVIHGVARSVDDALKIVDEGLVGYGYGDEDRTTW